jgi:hypothetical protein
LTGLVTCVGCDSKQEPTTQPAPGEETTQSLIAPESLKWSLEEACGRLADQRLGVSAAVQLVRLAEVEALCVPSELTDDHVRRLRLLSLAEGRWALGLADRQSERQLRAPVLISNDGEVTLLAEGTEEEMLVLHLSEDTDLFPHLVTLPQRVLLVDEEVVPAMVLEPDQKVCFELRRERGFGYVALVLAQPGNRQEVARYRWDPYECMFVGPAADALPDPPGGKFEIDLELSEGLVPVGGEIPEPEPNQPKPPAPQGPVPDDEWLPA